MIGCRSLFSSCRIDRVLRFTNTYVASSNPNSSFYFQGQSDYHCLSCNFVMGGRKKKVYLEDDSKKHKIVNSIWRPVATHASSCEESLIKDETNESKDGSEVREVGCTSSSNISSVMKVVNEAMDENTESPTSSSPLQDNVKNKVVGGGSSLSTGKHSISVEAVNSRSLDYSHFISLPLAIHPELVNKLINFQNSILGIGNSCMDENHDTDSIEDEDTTDSKEVDQLSKENADVAVELKVDGHSESVKVNFTNIPLVSYVPKASKSSASSDLGIDRSIFIKPKTFHLTVLMLKLWNKDRVKTASEVLQSISSKVLEALDNRPLSIRLKGLDCMKGSLAKARVLYAPVEEIGSEGRLLRACQIIIDAYVDAGLVLEGDAKQKLKLHATVMNARHRKRVKWTKKSSDSFDARGIFKRYGSEDWGQYLIREAHLSQRFSFDEHGYYHCCTSIPFPENVQVE
ncbi:PREDICTED: uncharacterized protein LOC109351224 isoform X3 [Lupinus angustifolius]|uniref:uncharacterized protein LOC109351224 isoform X3 n=1 Tax=Lupinus angustifolius TaxID=3871 RepID=UPI00092EB4F2|nr:PREDICTED: uncharacterized protein LOC109351224 isoform X3 [Lupinus angustifolius]